MMTAPVFRVRPTHTRNFIPTVSEEGLKNAIKLEVSLFRSSQNGAQSGLQNQGTEKSLSSASTPASTPSGRRSAAKKGSASKRSVVPELILENPQQNDENQGSDILLFDDGNGVQQPSQPVELISEEQVNKIKNKAFSSVKKGGRSVNSIKKVDMTDFQ